MKLSEHLWWSDDLFMGRDKSKSLSTDEAVSEISENEQAEDMYERVCVRILGLIFDQTFSKIAKTICLKVKI